MNTIILSYALTTRNKLPYLKEVMKRLLANLQENEEIVIADGASTDGTVEYLTELYKQGKIHQFISEPDKGEAHGYNKCLLMARGKLIKIITDDDAFYYPAIQECKNFMLEHEEIDVMSGNVAGVCLEELNKFRVLTECEHNYKSWLHTSNAVWFIGLPLMIRKKSLALTGLFFTGVIQIDTEYSLRITSLNVNIAWNTALMVVRIDNPKSNFRNFKLDNKAEEERDRMWFFYDHQYRDKIKNPIETVTPITKIKQSLQLVKRIVYKLVYCKKNDSISSPNSANADNAMIILDDIVTSNIDDAFSICDKFLSEYNSKNLSSFLQKKLYANQTN